MASGVYLIENKVSGKKYVGSTIDLHKRRIQHFSGLERGDHKNRHMQNAWKKHGPDAFSYSVLLICAEENLLFYEQQCIDFYDSARIGYNILPNAGRTAGRTPSPESIEKMAATKRGVPMRPQVKARHAAAMRSAEVREKISKALKGAVYPPKTVEHLSKIAAANTGKKHSEERRKRQSESMTGVSQGKRSEEAKARMSAAQKGRVISPEHAAAISVGRQRRYAELNAEKARLKAEREAMKTENGGYAHSAESREKISASKKGMKLSDGHRAALSEAAKKRCARQKIERDAAKMLLPPEPESPLKMTKVDGKWRQSEAFKQKLSEERKGKKFTEEHKEALRIARRKRAERERLAKLEGNA